MINYFSLAVISLFLLAGAAEFAQQNWARSCFYVLSAAINACVIFLK